MDAVETVRRLYNSFAEGDLAAVLAACSPDVVIAQDDALPWGGEHLGHQGVATFAAKLAENDSHVITEEIYAAGDRVVQYGRTQGTVRANGATYDIPECHIFTVLDGKITRAEFYIDSAAMLEVLAR